MCLAGSRLHWFVIRCMWRRCTRAPTTRTRRSNQWTSQTRSVSAPTRTDELFWAHIVSLVTIWAHTLGLFRGLCTKAEHLIGCKLAGMLWDVEWGFLCCSLLTAYSRCGGADACMECSKVWIHWFSTGSDRRLANCHSCIVMDTVSAIMCRVRELKHLLR
jgi:hypothetical protein